MAGARPAAGGGRRVAVDPERLERWLTGFADRHGGPEVGVGAAVVRLTGADGATADCEIPFPPLLPTTAPYGGLVAHALAERQVGILLVRLGGFAAGIAVGARLQSGTTGRRPVHGRAAAGGTSQHRFARRREGQARVARDAAADTAAEVLLPALSELDAVVRGGDRRALDLVLADPRLRPVLPLLAPVVLDVPDPRRDVLNHAPALARAVRIVLREPGSGS